MATSTLGNAHVLTRHSKLKNRRGMGQGLRYLKMWNSGTFWNRLLVPPSGHLDREDREEEDLDGRARRIPERTRDAHAPAHVRGHQQRGSPGPLRHDDLSDFAEFTSLVVA